MDTDTKTNLSDRTIWVRILYMLFFTFAFSIAEFLVGVIAVFQAIVVLITGRVNDSLHGFGKNLSVYIAEILEFQTFNSEELAFPFADWPDEPVSHTRWSEDEEWTAEETSEAPEDVRESEIEATDDVEDPDDEDPHDPDPSRA